MFISNESYSNEICSHEDVKFRVLKWLQHQPRQLLAEDLHRLARRWDISLKVYEIILIASVSFKTVLIQI
jgi:hypothetical protein